MSRPNWDEYFIGIADAVAARADCTRRQVGAVLVDAEHRIVSTGYNGAPAGDPGCASAGACPRGRLNVVPTRTQYAEGAGKCIAVHAEVNAIEYAQDIAGVPWPLTLYVTCEPCPPCYEAIARWDVAITRVVWPEGRG